MANTQKNISKDIKYLGRDFDSLKQGLIDFTKTYYPTTYNDFNETSPGMMFVEMAAYVGDVLNYYIDSQFKESLLLHATETESLMSIAAAMGYKPKLSVPAIVDLDVYQLMPASGSGANVVPDLNYAIKVGSGMRARSAAGSVEFIAQNSIDFTVNNVFDPTTISVYSIDANGAPNYFLAKKTVQAISATPQTITVTVTSPTKFFKTIVEDPSIIGIDSIVDSNGNVWYEVPYLAQDTIFENVPNLLENDPDLYQYRSSSPSLLKMKKTAKRFVTRLRSDNRLEIQFGAGISDNNDEEIIPNPDNVGNGLAGFRRAVDVDIDPSNFLYTRTYGQAPSNTTLTVTYTVGNGISDNVGANLLTNINFVEYNDNVNSSNSAPLVNFIKTTIAVNNAIPAAGAKTADTLQDIKNNALANFATQNRLVTREDYIIRSYSMPSKYGSVAKAYIVPDDQISQQENQDITIANPLAMNMYILGFNDLKQLTPLNQAIKENLKTYLNFYRILTDAVNIKDAFIINIGVDFEISVLPKVN